MNGMATRNLSEYFYSVSYRFLVALAVVVPCSVAGWIAIAWRQDHQRATATMSAIATDAAFVFHNMASADEAAWSVLSPGRTPINAQSSGDKRWRLAGTFFSFPEQGESACKAILDDLAKNTQVLVAEGETLDDMRVVRIFADHVVIEQNGRQDVLWLSFSEQHAPPDQRTSEASSPEQIKPQLEKTKYGTRIGERRWVMNRDALLAYCNELRDDPERIGKLYVSMKPEYTADNRISGYRVQMEGEQDFFAAAGLKEGDIVRKVNSLEMTSQARAEYFIQEFLQGRLNAVVLDIERSGQPEKLIYLIR